MHPSLQLRLKWLLRALVEPASEPDSNPAVSQQFAGSSQGFRHDPRIGGARSVQGSPQGWGRTQDLIFVPEYRFETLAKDRRIADGALLHKVRIPLGYWEAKDEKDDLEEEIELKFPEDTRRTTSF